MDEPEESPKRVTRADAFPLVPRPALVARVSPPSTSDDAGSALKSFLVSVFIGTGSFIFLASGTRTHTCGAQRSATLERRQQQAEARAELRAAEEAS